MGDAAKFILIVLACLALSAISVHINFNFLPF